MRLLIGFFLASVQLGGTFKFLAFSPQFALSHVNFIAKISDTLVEAGHEVVIVAPRVHPSIRGALTKKARVVELPENEYTRGYHDEETRLLDKWWNSSGISILMSAGKMFTHMFNGANATLNHPGLIDQLRAEKFDAAFTENPFGFGLFHLAGIDRTALAVSFGNFESVYALTQIPSAPAYVPCIYTNSLYGDRMPFFGRLANTLCSLSFNALFRYIVGSMQFAFDPFGTSLLDTSASNSLVLLNSEPLLDFPRPTVHRVVEIGGITIATDHDPIDEYWSEVLDRRNRTVFLSFGSYIRASQMPERYKQTIRSVLSKFDDITFIWKYESPEHNVSKGIANIVETKWLPQVPLLNDRRLTAFITHGGHGSVLEAAYAGKPMLIVPTLGDHHRNAAMIKRAGLGVTMQLGELEEEQLFERMLRDLLDNKEYTIKARQMSEMLKNRPFSAKEKVVRNMEFLAQYGPLRMLDHEGRNLNFVQYYSLDVFIFLAFIITALLALLGTFCIIIHRSCSFKIRWQYTGLKQD